MKRLALTLCLSISSAVFASGGLLASEDEFLIEVVAVSESESTILGRITDAEDDSPLDEGDELLVIVNESTRYDDLEGFNSIEIETELEVEGQLVGNELLASEVELEEPENEDGCDPLEYPLNARFSLDSVEARPGAEFELPLFVSAGAPLALVTWSVEFDPEVFEFVEPRLSDLALEALENRPQDSDFAWFGGDLDGGNEEGWMQASLVFDRQARAEFSLPSVPDGHVAALCFRVRPGAAPGEQALRFTQELAPGFETRFRSSIAEIYNAARPTGVAFDDDDEHEEAEEACTFDSVVLVSEIIGEIGILRGDSNSDREVNISDPVHLLDFLFLSGAAPLCPEAADANEDASVDLSDAITLLDFLFLGSGFRPLPIEPPSGAQLAPGCVQTSP